MKEINLPYSLIGIHLNTSIAVFKHNPEWMEIIGSQKEYVDAGSPLSCPERMFKRTYGKKAIYCGFVFGRLYQIGILTPLSDLDFYLEEYSEQYGTPDETQVGHYVWGDDDVCLQLVKGEDLYIFLQDRKLLQKAKQ